MPCELNENMSPTNQEKTAPNPKEEGQKGVSKFLPLNKDDFSIGNRKPPPPTLHHQQNLFFFFLTYFIIFKNINIKNISPRCLPPPPTSRLG